MSSLSCPRCRVAMQAGSLPQGHGYACPRCGGVWLDNAASQRVSRVVCDQTMGFGRSAASSATSLTDLQAGIACPVCGVALTRSPLSNAKIELDACAAHGTWFDREELLKASQSYAVGRAYGGGAARTQAKTPVPAAATAQSSADSNGEVALEASLAAVDLAEVAGDSTDLVGSAFEALGDLFGAL